MSTSRISPNSQIDFLLHDPALVEMIYTPVNWGLVDYLVNRTTDAISCSTLFSHALKTAFFVNFVKDIIIKSRAMTPMLLVALGYMSRAGRALLDNLLHQWRCEQLFLGALILASKYIYEEPMGAAQWASLTGIFSVKDINRIEREYLILIQYNLGICEADLLAHYEPVFSRANSNVAQLRALQGSWSTTASDVVPINAILPTCTTQAQLLTFPASGPSSNGPSSDTPKVTAPGHCPDPSSRYHAPNASIFSHTRSFLRTSVVHLSPCAAGFCLPPLTFPLGPDISVLPSLRTLFTEHLCEPSYVGCEP
ncbi:uncharacterized protein FIBRA_06138 [Fibroporia radiculosa]|uniref:Cyclin N-terminal domain-containing protein n=1 Tax=Fibroporia radiculosa TaxID=599839 RepID=J4HYM8_9APHY|nr:uncharacterized protein FIBRA_06138 [Fibroporia radiculosa]CCM03982.1 predicted protein [Fibroporia radiculosa]